MGRARASQCGFPAKFPAVGDLLQAKVVGTLYTFVTPDDLQLLQVAVSARNRSGGIGFASNHMNDVRVSGDAESGHNR
jgi:hypothetical protein